MKENNVEVQIINLDHQGRGIGKIDEKVIFIPNALIDEVVLVKITYDNKRYFEGEVVKYIEKSKQRIKPLCPYYDECGGCDLLHLTYADQLAYKQNKIKEIMTKFASLDASLVQPIIANNQFNYRNKVTLQVKEVVGFYRKRTYDVIEIDACLISDPKINDLITLVKTLPLANVKQVIIRSSLNREDTMVVIDTNGEIDEAGIIQKLPNTNLVKKINNEYTSLLGKKYITEKLGEYQYVISPDSFFQVNTTGAKNLYDQILKYADLNHTEKVLDLYCGTGSIGLYLSKYADEVVGIESNQFAILDAHRNKDINGVRNITFKHGDVGTVLAGMDFQPDITIVDPPRTGLNKYAINQIFRIKAPKLIYVSCDPITLARDLKILEEMYEVLEITPVDMFPNTYHVECVVNLKLKPTTIM